MSGTTPAVSAPAETVAPSSSPTPVAETPVSKLRQLINEKFADKPETPSEGETPTTEEPQPDRLELNLVKAKQELKKLTVESVRLKEEHAAATKQINEFKQLFQTNPLKAMEQLSGKLLPEIWEAAKRGDYDDQSAKLPEEVKEKLSYIEQLQAREREREAKEAEERAKIERQKEFGAAVPKVKELLDSEADKYPYLAAVSTSPEAVLERVYEAIDAGEQPDIQAIFSDMNADALSQVKFWLGQPNLVKLALSDENTRQQLVDALGITKQNPPNSTSRIESPKLHSVGTLTEVGTRTDKKLTQAEKDQAIRDEWARMRSTNK